MATKPELSLSSNAGKPEISPAKQDIKPEEKITSKPVHEPVARMTASMLKAEMEKIDNEINSLVTSSLQQMGPGKPFNTAPMRLVAKQELKKHRLLMNRLAALLKKGHPEVRPIVEKLLTIEM